MKSIYLIGPDVKLKGGIASVIKSILSSTKLNKNYNMKSISTIGKTSKIILFLRSIMIVRKIKEDSIIHFNVASNGSFIRKYIVFKLLNKKTKKIFHLHGGGFLEYYSKSNCIVKSWVLEMLDGCCKIINVSDYMKDKVNDVFPNFSEKNIRIYNGINLCEVNADINVKKNEVLFIGKIVEYKGVYDFLKIIRNSKKVLIKNRWKVIIAGNGEIDKLNSIIQENKLDKLIEVRGWVEGEDKKRLLREASVVIVPSHIESFGIVAVEAMANGCTIIASNVGALPEIVSKKNGFIVDRGDITKFSSILNKVIEDDVLRKKIFYANVKAAMKFDEEKMYDKLLKVYSEI